MRDGSGPSPLAARRRLGFAAAGVLLGAADTYVVVVALPAIMAAVGIDLAHLQQAAPIISGFLLGYVAMLPLLGRLSDVFGRAPVLVFCLVAFAAGSLLTASANTLPVLVLGRTIQGAGGGGLVPVTLALVADLWPPRRRGVPLGVVGAVQEIGSVVGPLYGAALSTVSGWRAIFYVNMPLAAVIAAGVRAPARRLSASPVSAGRADVAGRVLGALCIATAVLAIASPPALSDSLAIGVAFAPLLGGAAVTSPIALAALASAAALLVRGLLVGPTVRAVLPLRGIRTALGRVDWPGALLVALILGMVVVTFASADPATGVVGPSAPIVLPLAGLLTVLLVIRELRADDPLIDIRVLAGRAAVGSLLTSLAAGAALMAALVDVPVFARTTVDPDSQLQAALVLARLLAAVPVGALVGGILADRTGYRVVAGAGLVLVSVSFALMAGWTRTTLAQDFAGAGWLHPSDPVLVAAGLGFGLAIVPVTAAILGAVPQRLHGVAASLTVAARLVGMLAGLSVLTGVGLRRFYSVQAMLTPAARLCPDTPLHCPAYDALETGAVVDELHLIFLGAAACALAGALFAVALLRRPAEVPPTPLAVAA